MSTLTSQYGRMPARSRWLFATLSSGASVALCAAVYIDRLDILVGIVAFSLLVFWCLVRPQLALIVVIAASVLLPVTISAHYGSMPRVSPVRVLLAALFCAECYRFVVLGKRVGSFSDVPLIGWVVTFLAYKTLAAFVSIDPGRSMISVASTVLEFIFPFYLVSAYIKQPEFWPKLRKALYVVAVIVCALALLEQLTHANPLIGLLDGQELEFRAGLLRVRSTFFHPIALACFINLLMPFVLLDLFRATKAISQLGLLAFSLLLVLVSVMTVSRIPLLMLAAEIGVVCVWWLRANGRSLLLYGCCFGLVLTGALFTVVQSDSLSSQFEEVMNPNHIVQGRINEASSEFYRVALFRAVVDRLQGWRWITGVGSGTFHLADVESNYDGDDHVLTAPDSHYVKLLLEVGILGVILAATIGVKCLVLCWRAIHSEGGERQFTSVGATAGIVAFLIINATVSMFDVFPLSILFWLNVAICGKELYRGRSSDHIGIDSVLCRTSPQPSKVTI